MHFLETIGGGPGEPNFWIFWRGSKGVLAGIKKNRCKDGNEPLTVKSFQIRAGEERDKKD